MILDFEKMDFTVIPQFYGGEKETTAKMFVDDDNRILSGKLSPGASIGTHRHETNSEIIYILKGSGTAVCDGVPEKLFAGMCHYCPKGHTHSLLNDGAEDLFFFAVVPQHGKL